jgi:hypothetical protein
MALYKYICVYDFFLGYLLRILYIIYIFKINIDAIFFYKNLNPKKTMNF